MPVRHRMKLSPDSFDKVKSGDKTVEARLNDEKRKAFQVGEHIEFAKLPELEKDLIVEITSLITYPTFKDMYQNSPTGALGYSEAEFLERVFTHYTTEEEAKYGVVAIGIKLV